MWRLLADVSVPSGGAVWLWDTGSGRAIIQLRESSGPCEAREFTVSAEKVGIFWNELTSRQFSIVFSPDGGKITRTSVLPDPKGAIVRVKTWDGSPRLK
jgi:hypothetical protein